MKKIRYVVLLVIFAMGLHVQGQERTTITINEGVLSVSPKALVFFEGTFENKEEGNVTNDGLVFYFEDFINNGYYGLTPSHKTSTTVFLTNGSSTKAKQIKGNTLASFYNIAFNGTPGKVVFDLKNNIDIYGTVDFQDGIIKVDSLINPVTNLSYGMFTMHPGSQAINARDDSFIQGVVEKIGNESFTYPIGDHQKYRPARISAPKESDDVFISQYIYQDATFFSERKNAVGAIKQVNDQEYWLLEKGNTKSSNVLLTLSWDERTTAVEMLKDPEAELHIVRWDENQKIWVDEGGVVDMSTQEITTVATVKGYGIFTLATVKKDWVLDGDVVIYNLVTPDGDGKNDYFIIDNIHNYPNNKVEIFNRWGARVYETRGYDPLGDGSSNVFRGYSEGKVTVDKGSKLPSGTYYYVITYEYTDSHGSRMIKKAANLHLENN